MSTSERIPTVLCYDVENIIAPESDEAVLWMSEMLSEYDLTHTHNVDLSNLLEQAKLQCWTLKPAWPRSKVE